MGRVFGQLNRSTPSTYTLIAVALMVAAAWCQAPSRWPVIGPRHFMCEPATRLETSRSAMWRRIMYWSPPLTISDPSPPLSRVVARYQALRVMSVVGFSAGGMGASCTAWRGVRRKARLEGLGKPSVGTRGAGACAGAPLAPVYVPVRLLPEASMAMAPASSNFQYRFGAGRAT